MEKKSKKYSHYKNDEDIQEVIKISKRLLEDIEATTKIKSNCLKANKAIDMDIQNYINELSSDSYMEFKEIKEYENKLRSKKHKILSNCARDLDIISKREFEMLENARKIYKLTLVLESELKIDEARVKILMNHLRTTN